MEKERLIVEIEFILGQIVEKYKPLKVILFGSAARGEYQDCNDLDFLIIKDNVPLYGLERMRQLDDLIERNIAADMIVYRSEEFEKRLELGDPFVKNIVKEGRILYG